MNKKILLLLLVCGCAHSVPQHFTFDSGSKGDGIAKVSYTFSSILNVPSHNYNQAHSVALAACENWGYSSAQKGATDKECLSNVDEWGNCKTQKVIVTYQCY